MKHGVHMRTLNRTSSHRWAMLRNMVAALVKHERIETTLPKAKELRRVADRLVTYAKNGSRVRAIQVLPDSTLVEKVFNTLAPRYSARAGGYTRVLRANNRTGDNADMAYIEFVDREGELRTARIPAAVPPASSALLHALQAARARENQGVHSYFGPLPKPEK